MFRVLARSLAAADQIDLVLAVRAEVMAIAAAIRNGAPQGNRHRRPCDSSQRLPRRPQTGTRTGDLP
jgi:hypothetical protein